MMGLTHKQRELLDFIGERLATDGVCPSFEEMKCALGLKAKSGIHRLLTALEERGYIQRLPSRARAIEIIENPKPLLSIPANRALGRVPEGDLLNELASRGFKVIRTDMGSVFCNRFSA